MDCSPAGAVVADAAERDHQAISVDKCIDQSHFFSFEHETAQPNQLQRHGIDIDPIWIVPPLRRSECAHGYDLAKIMRGLRNSPLRSRSRFDAKAGPGAHAQRNSRRCNEIAQGSGNALRAAPDGMPPARRAIGARFMENRSGETPSTMPSSSCLPAAAIDQSPGRIASQAIDGNRFSISQEHGFMRGAMVDQSIDGFRTTCPAVVPPDGLSDPLRSDKAACRAGRDGHECRRWRRSGSLGEARAAFAILGCWQEQRIYLPHRANSAPIRANDRPRPIRTPPANKI